MTMSTPGPEIRIRLVFADEGAFHSVVINIPSGPDGEYDRLIDRIREDPEVTRQLYVDMKRLVSATVEPE